MVTKLKNRSLKTVMVPQCIDIICFPTIKFIYSKYRHKCPWLKLPLRSKGGKNVEKILGVSGSPRAGGNADTLLEKFLDGANEAGVEIEIFHLRNYNINYCVGCEQCRRDKTCTRFDDGMSLIYPKIQESKGLIIGSPVHNYNVTAITKSFIDRLYPYYDFTPGKPRAWSSRLAGQGRGAVVFAVGEQNTSEDLGCSLFALAQPLRALGFNVKKEIPFLGFFNKGSVAGNEVAMELAFKSGFDFGRTFDI